ncbi:MAG TPA: 2-hydroxyacyl-CoA dehydratase, partial [Deltaproteobacteria bacterium]|nr:2-hydroxyacyl-CoA dehydratase [Deltaproteobacteria bacterium]
MARKEYLLKQKQLGRRLLGVFPAQYPKEILWAMNLLPVEIWDPPLESSNANAHLQPYICSVVKQGLELILQGKADMLEGFLFPHTCDSIQNLASIINDYLKLEKPCFFFYHPKAPYHACSRDYYLDQMRLLITSLERDFGPMDPAALGQSVEQGRRLSGIIREIYDLRSKGELSASNVRFYEVIRQGEYLHPDDFIPLLEEFVQTHKGKAQK